MKNEATRTLLKAIAVTLVLLTGVGILFSFVSRAPESERVVYRTVEDVSLTLDIIPIKTAEAFVAAAEESGAKAVKLIRYEGKGHEFYLHGPGSGKAFKSSMKEVITFLGELGWTPEEQSTN